MRPAAPVSDTFLKRGRTPVELRAWPGFVSRHHGAGSLQATQECAKPCLFAKAWGATPRRDQAVLFDRWPDDAGHSCLLALLRIGPNY